MCSLVWVKSEDWVECRVNFQMQQKVEQLIIANSANVTQPRTAMAITVPLFVGFAFFLTASALQMYGSGSIVVIRKGILVMFLTFIRVQLIQINSFDTKKLFFYTCQFGRLGLAQNCPPCNFFCVKRISKVSWTLSTYPQNLRSCKQNSTPIKYGIFLTARQIRGT